MRRSDIPKHLAETVGPDEETITSFPAPENKPSELATNLSTITNERFKEIILEEYKRLYPDKKAVTLNDWDRLFQKEYTDEEKRCIQIQGKIDDILLTFGETVNAKPKLIEFVESLQNPEDIKTAEDYIGKKIEHVIRHLENLIVSGQYNSVFDSEEGYFTFLSHMQIWVILLLPLNPNLRRKLAIDLFYMYSNLRVKDVPPQYLGIFREYLNNFISGIKMKFELPETLRIPLQKLTQKEIEGNTDAKLPQRTGEHSLAHFQIIPPIHAFPDIYPDKKEADNLLEEIRKPLVEMLINSSTFEIFINIEAELMLSDNPEHEFTAFCKLKRQAIEKMLDKSKDLKEKLEIIVNKAKRQGIKVEKNMVANYMEILENYINSIWEKAIFPSLLFYGHILLGTPDKQRQKWS